MCPDGAHNARRMDDLGGGVWWCGIEDRPGPHFVVVAAAARTTAPKHASPSSIATARQCLHRYWAEYVLRHRPPPGPEAVRGTFSHKVLELTAGEPDGQRDLDRARKLANSEWRTFMHGDDFQRLRLTTDQSREFTGKAIAAVAVALELWPLNGRDIIGAELRFELHVNGVKMHGVIDLAERPTDPVLVAHGYRLFVTDYKTGKVPISVHRQSKWDRKLWVPGTFAGPPPDPPAHDGEAEKLIQAHIYNAAARQLHEIPNQREVGAQLLYVGDDTGVVMADPHDTRQALAAVKTTWRQIEQAHEDGWWPATVGPLCGWCPHMAWDNGDGTWQFCGDGLRYAFNRLESPYGWTKYGTNEPVPAAVTIRQMDPDVRRQARQAADAAVVKPTAPWP